MYLFRVSFVLIVTLYYLHFTKLESIFLLQHAGSGALTVSTSTSRPGTSALPTTAPDPALVAAQRRRKANRTPCSVCYTAEGQLAVGYRSGGVAVYAAYEAYPMGVLEKLPVSGMCELWFIGRI